MTDPSTNASPLGPLATAVAAAQLEMKNPGKSQTAEIMGKDGKRGRTYRYPSLADGLDAIRVLAKHGVMVTQPTRIRDDLMIVDTYLIHGQSGESIQSEYPVGRWTNLPHQQLGAALTYARRYALFSLCGIAGTDEDDDAQSIAGIQTSAGPETIDFDQHQYLVQLLEDTKSDVGKFLDHLKADSLADLTVEQYQKGLEGLMRKANQMKDSR